MKLTTNPIMRRVSYIFLCLVPFLNFAVVGVRALRIPGLYQVGGIIYFVAIAGAVWTLARRAVTQGSGGKTRIVWAAGFFIAPTALVALLWVGLGGPWQATPEENRMRYMVLTTSSIAVTVGFLLLEEGIRQAGETFLSKIGATFATLAGAAYVVWNTIYLGLFVIWVSAGKIPTELKGLFRVFDSLLDAACVLTYLATLIFALGMAKVGLLGRRGKFGFSMASLILLGFLLLRGLSYPDPNVTRWYLSLGFIAGIPAVPWIMPYLFGVVLLRRVGEDAVVKQA